MGQIHPSQAGMTITTTIKLRDREIGSNYFSDIFSDKGDSLKEIKAPIKQPTDINSKIKMNNTTETHNGDSKR